MLKRCPCGNEFVTNNPAVTKCCLCRGLGKSRKVNWGKIGLVLIVVFFVLCAIGTAMGWWNLPAPPNYRPR